MIGEFNPFIFKVITDPITSWQIDVETIETVTDFIFLGSKITADGDFSHEIMSYQMLIKGKKDVCRDRKEYREAKTIFQAKRNR